MVVSKKQIKTSSDKSSKDTRKGRLQKLQSFFKGVLNELKKVHWPSRKQTAIYTGVVLISVLVIAFLIFVVDQIFSGILQLFISR